MTTQTASPTLVGSVWVDVWGYSMTIVDYYVVELETPKTVILRKIGAIEKATGYLAGDSKPDVTNIGDKQFRAQKYTRHDGELGLKSGALGYSGSTHYLTQWKGEKHYFNHCD